MPDRPGPWPSGQPRPRDCRRRCLRPRPAARHPRPAHRHWPPPRRWHRSSRRPRPGSAFGRKPIVHRNDGLPGPGTDMTAGLVVTVETADHPATAVKVHDGARPPVTGPIDPNTDVGFRPGNRAVGHFAADRGRDFGWRRDLEIAGLLGSHGPEIRDFHGTPTGQGWIESRNRVAWFGPFPARAVIQPEAITKRGGRPIVSSSVGVEDFAHIHGKAAQEEPNPHAGRDRNDRVRRRPRPLERAPLQSRPSG